MRTVQLLLLLICTHSSIAQQWVPAAYEIGTPIWQDIWINPLNGNNASSGATSNQAVLTITEAWNRIPSGVTLTNHGYRLRLLPGNHSTVPNYWESRHGTPACPILLQVEGTNGAAVLPDLNIYDCSHLYFSGLRFNKTVSGGDGFHIERGRHVLLRDCVIAGNGLAHEGIKVNQSQHIYLENCDISGAGDNAVDFVAVQYGHIVRSRIHDAGDWALYVKGGSAYILIDANEVYDAGTGGITAGQGTGFEFMESPWIHYEAYDIKIVNNLIHDVEGAGLGVNGGYNILLAYNTLVRVGERSHVIEVVHGHRGCDGNTSACESNRVAGGWGTAGTEEQYIPNRNIFVFHNVVFNPAPYQSQWQHFAIHGPRVPPMNSNVTNPARADDNLLIRGNVIWNGPSNHPVLGDSGGCQAGNCTEALLLSENHINEWIPQFVNAVAGDYRPSITGNLFTAQVYPIPDFPGGDRPAIPMTPSGVEINEVKRDRNGYPRHQVLSPPGVYTGGSSQRLGINHPTQLILSGESGYVYRIEFSSSGSWLPLFNRTVTTQTEYIEVALPTNDIQRNFRSVLLP